MPAPARWPARHLVLALAGGGLVGLADGHARPLRAQSPSAQKVAAAAIVAQGVVDAELRAIHEQIAKAIAIVDALRRRSTDCAPGGRKFLTPACATDTSLIAGVPSLEEAMAAARTADEERRELEAMLAALRAIASNSRMATLVADVLEGRAAALRVDGLTAHREAIDRSLTVDRARHSLPFSTGRLRHCFSPRSVCGARPYALVR